jgi:hypothetical protein
LMCATGLVLSVSRHLHSNPKLTSKGSGMG